MSQVHVPNIQDILMYFTQNLENMKDWPDKAIIMDLTAITENNINYAHNFVNIIISRLISTQTHSSYKLPMFYLMDSIMKHVGGPYAALFSKHFIDIFPISVQNLHESDRKKLLFLIGTWEERKLLPPELLQNMKENVLKPQINLSFSTAAIPPTRPVVPMNFNQLPLPYQQQQVHQQLHNIIQPPQIIGNIQPIGIPSHMDPLTASMFHDLVKNEMVNMLNQMYIEMNIKNPLSLDELMKANPSLYNQIQTKAEENAKIVLNKRNQQQQQQQLNPAYVQNQSVDYQHTTVPNYHGRGADQSHLNIIHRIDNPYINQQLQTKNPYINMNNSNVVMHQHNMIDSHSNNNQSMNQNITVMQSGSGPFQNTMLLPKLQNRKRSADYNIISESKFQQPSIVQNQHIHKVDNTNTLIQRNNNSFITSNPSIENNNPPLTSSTTNSIDNIEQQMKQIASEFYVNGFICEFPVIIDINRAQALTNNLVSTNDNEQLVCTTTTTILNNNFKEVANRVSKRLQMYLDNALIPPKLPSILFGPLPSEPITKPPVVEINKIEPPKIKLPIPQFKVEELGRNPEVILNALYNEKPHQFHEDGLRFSSLSLLKQHTDEYMERKKLLLKKKSITSREYRDWFCTSAQWITDFNALHTNDMNISCTNSSNKDMIDNTYNKSLHNNMNIMEDIEYIVPADEFFTRCPVSREVFDCMWDAEEGEMMYRNAVKVLITDNVDSNLFKLAQSVSYLDSNIDNKDHNMIRYMIVHKILVMNQWLDTGKAVSLKDALLHYDSIGSNIGTLMKNIVNIENDDEDEVFVVIQ